MSRREYPLSLSINGRKIKKVVIDPHYEEKHSESINDELILELVKLLDGSRAEPEKRVDGFEYFASDNLLLDDKLYKLVWLLEDNAIYIGIVNAHRR
ncbi:MAG: hypothetical protein H6626_12615 [Pseudobdellovibrionaceae bacterium]|nr:hypothetical protein [Bdellovibrionales bacterium]USN47020.1 MAG: hypothetical protein H6626_12615 [Pseudobdellovibrionaceae bacterium]